MLTRCPICNNNIFWDIYTGPLGTEEEYINCPFCKYRYEFIYGGNLLVVGNKYFIWGHYTNRKNNPRLFKKMDKALFMARRRWKKHKKGTYAKGCPA